MRPWIQAELVYLIATATGTIVRYDSYEVILSGVGFYYGLSGFHGKQIRESVLRSNDHCFFFLHDDQPYVRCQACHIAFF